MKDICRSCILCLPPYQCCYQEFLLTGRECSFRTCFFSQVCPHANQEYFKNRDLLLSKTLDEATPGLFQKIAMTLPSAFIPEIMPMKKEAKEALLIAKNINVPIIAVSLQNFFRGIHETLMLRKARKSGLHQFFDYPGKIILTTDVKNHLCDKFTENPYYFKMLVKQLNPDYVTTLDTYTHSNVPACIARLKVMEATLSSYVLMDLNIETIGLAVGATPYQVYSCVDALMKMGCKIIAHPVYEFRKAADIDSIRWRLRVSEMFGAKTLLLSCSAGVSSKMRVYSNYYSTWSWFSSVSSRDTNAHNKRKLKLQKMIELGRNCSEQSHL
jgi:hypothetical protein